MEADEERLDLGWSLLEQGEPRGALEAAQALLAENPVHAEAAYLAATSLLELGEREAAEAQLKQLLEIQPANDPVRLTYAGLLYESCRLDEAEAEVARLGADTLQEAPALWLRGLLLDARGNPGGADECFARASRIDADRYPVPVTLPRDEFDAAVAAAVESLPEEFASRLDEVPVLVEEIPAPALWRTMESPSPDLLGLFVGTPLPLRSHADSGALPPAIYLFKRNLEREAIDREDLVEQIRVTLLHELGHFLGMDEEELDDAGYA